MQTKLLTKGIPFTFRRNGYYYFTRRVPSDLHHLYQCRRIVIGLRTKSEQVAWRRAVLEAAKLETAWDQMRSVGSTARFESCKVAIAPQPKGPAQSKAHGVALEVPSLSAALDIYVSIKGESGSALFEASARRACSYLVGACGDMSLDQYTRQDALKFRTALVQRGLSASSISRIVGSVRAMFRFVTSELGLRLDCPFEKLYIGQTSTVGVRAPIAPLDIRRVQQLCRETPDEIRLLISLVSDTGMRLAEACGMALDDLILDGDQVPHVKLQVHPWRRLKNASSARCIPLVGESLWAATEIRRSASQRWFAFPRYNSSGKTNANAASAATNKWLKQVLQKDVSMHGFRHSLRDRLRAVECPSEMIDQIGGWTTPGVGNAYGKGYPLSVLHGWLERVVFNQ